MSCRILGHKLKRCETTGVSPRLFKVIHRVVYICERKGCDFREIHDTAIADFDLREGINLWGSGGVCYGCKKEESCAFSPRNAKVGNLPLSAIIGGFCYIHCPIKAFEIKDEEKHRLEECGDILVT